MLQAALLLLLQFLFINVHFFISVFCCDQELKHPIHHSSQSAALIGYCSYSVRRTKILNMLYS